MVIALIALIVVGPEQLPGLLRKAGQLTAQVRTLSNSFRDEFMNGLDQADPTRWTGEGTDQNPIVPRGYSSSPGSAPSTDGQAGDHADQTDQTGPPETEPPETEPPETGPADEGPAS